MRLVFTVREGANPELYADLEGRDSRERPERVRYLATLGLLISQGQIEAAGGMAAVGGMAVAPGSVSNGQTETRAQEGPPPEDRSGEGPNQGRLPSAEESSEVERGLAIARRFRRQYSG